MNKYESDAICTSLEKMGYRVFDGLEKADVYLINTCAVTSEAEKKSRQMIARARKLNPNAKILVCGCASQNNKLQFEEKGVDYVSGCGGKNFVATYIDLIAKGEKINSLEVGNGLQYEEMDFAKQTRSRAYIKIQDGCNNFCSYCIIPFLRGRSRSRALDSILQEAKSLPEFVKEIVLTGINVTDFKIEGKSGLLKLLQQLDPLGKRIRLSSLEETLVDEEFVQNLAKLKNFCPFFHLSLQSGSEKVLQSMNRRYTPAQFKKSVEIIRKYFKNPGITTDVIVGFPTETDEFFEESYNFIKQIGFSGLHIFQYSKRPGTMAARAKDLPALIKKERAKKLEELDKNLRRNFVCQNQTVQVLVEEKEGEFYVGYSKNYIKCYIQSDKNLVGEVVFAKVVRPYLEGARAEIVKN